MAGDTVERSTMRSLWQADGGARGGEGLLGPGAPERERTFPASTYLSPILLRCDVSGDR